jgi:hypothetical protein
MAKIMNKCTLLSIALFPLSFFPVLADDTHRPVSYTSVEDQQFVLRGQWTGTMLIGPKEYPINLWFEGDRILTGRIELIGVTTANNQLNAISVSRNKVTFELASRPPQKFQGEIRNETMSGTIDIAGMMASFSVQKLVQ